MKKSWVSYFLPKDEYKESRMLYFIAEAFFIFLTGLVLAIALSYFSDFWNQDIVLILLTILICLSFYILIRYIGSGIEYVDVVETSDYRMELNKIIFRSLKFAVNFAVISSALKITKFISFDWIDIMGVTSIAFVLFIAINYMSLRASFKKNQ